MDLLTVAAACGHLVHPAMTERVIQIESQGQPFAIHDNSTARQWTPSTLSEAVHVAHALIASGHNLDLGLMQINYRVWLQPTAFPLERAFDACTNVALGTTILSANYASALTRSTSSDDALMKALSQYNSGSDVRSLGYAHQVLWGTRVATSARIDRRHTTDLAQHAPVTFTGR